MHSLIRSVAALVALMVVSLVHAAELVVPTQYPSIQSAINASVSGDIITVRPGTYNERLDIGGRNITLRSLLGPNATIIDPQGVGGVVIQSTNAAANGWVLQGFTIRNGLDSALYVSGVTATVRNCKFINNQASRGGGAHVRAGATVLLRDLLGTHQYLRIVSSRRTWRTVGSFAEERSIQKAPPGRQQTVHSWETARNAQTTPAIRQARTRALEVDSLRWVRQSA